MFFHLVVLLGGMFLLLPVLVIGLAWANLSSFYRSEIPRRQRCFYLIALTAGSVSTASYLGYWGWRICQLYNVALSLSALLALDRAIAASRSSRLLRSDASSSDGDHIGLFWYQPAFGLQSDSGSTVVSSIGPNEQGL